MLLDELVASVIANSGTCFIGASASSTFLPGLLLLIHPVGRPVGVGGPLLHGVAHMLSHLSSVVPDRPCQRHTHSPAVRLCGLRQQSKHNPAPLAPLKHASHQLSSCSSLHAQPRLFTSASLQHTWQLAVGCSALSAR